LVAPGCFVGFAFFTPRTFWPPFLAHTTSTWRASCVESHVVQLFEADAPF
jgi:hypothetical protein